MLTFADELRLRAYRLQVRRLRRILHWRLFVTSSSASELAQKLAEVEERAAELAVRKSSSDASDQVV